MSDEEVLKALAALKAADAELEASPAVEMRLREAFRKRHQERQHQERQLTRKLKFGAYLALAAAAAIVVILSVWPQHEAPKTPVEVHVAAPPEPAQAEVFAPVRAVAAKPAHKVVRRRPQPSEITTEFFPLLDVAPPFERGELVRVRLPAAAMRTVGLPVSEEHLADPVQADVLIGEEGLARAIRFVKFVR